MGSPTGSPRLSSLGKTGHCLLIRLSYDFPYPKERFELRGDPFKRREVIRRPGIEAAQLRIESVKSVDCLHRVARFTTEILKEEW